MEIVTAKLSLEIIIAILTIVGILIKVVMFLRKKITEQFSSITKVHSQVESIFKEITPNGGGSIKDKINLMSCEITENTKLTNKIFYRQRWIMDRRSEPIFEATSAGEYVWVNLPFIELVQRERDGLLGHNWKNIIHEDDRQRVISNWESSVKEGRAYEDEYRIVSPSGKITTVAASAINSNNSGYIGYLSIVDKKN
jgi:PAS domain S-box-containing protein